MKAITALIENEALLDEGVQQDIHRRLAAVPVEESPLVGSGPVQFYLRSIHWYNGVLYGIARYSADVNSEMVSAGARVLFCASRDRPRSDALGNLRLAYRSDSTPWIATAEPTFENAHALHELFPWTKPISLRERRTTIGMGDRLGIATPGHIRAIRRFHASPVFAQQSIRENTFTGRTFDDVVAAVTWSVFQEGYHDGYGADGDHLKDVASIDTAIAASMPMITLDLTEVMRPELADYTDDEIESEFQKLDPHVRSRVEAEYVDQRYTIDEVEVPFTEVEAKRCAVMYDAAIALCRRVNDHLDQRTGGTYDLEISIDETTTPTLPAHHLFIARELQHRGVAVNSIAPRFVGEFQKAIDYVGKIPEFTEQFALHCRIAETYGGYKLSVHSGSDKFTVFPVIGRETGLRLHLKTSGTSWLEALRTIARYEPPLYRDIHRFVLTYYPTALSYYHISADFDAIEPLDTVSDDRLPSYLDDENARQMLHISYGGIFGNDELRRRLYTALHRFEEEYASALHRHFEKHLLALGVPRR